MRISTDFQFYDDVKPEFVTLMKDAVTVAENYFSDLLYVLPEKNPIVISDFHDEYTTGITGTCISR